MSKYTTEVRFLCEVESGNTDSKGFNSIDSILTIAAPKIFNFDFPIFDESYRLPLEKKILRHYYTREICEETVGLWKLRLQDKLNMIMPYYNKLYASELIQFNPLYEVDLKTEKTIVNQGEKSSEEIGNTVSNENIVSERNQGANSEKTNSSNTSSVSDSNNLSSDNKTTNDTTQNVNAVVSTSESSTDDMSENTNVTSNTNSSSGQNTSSVTKNDTRKDKYSDTPQGSISNLENNTYLTNARIITDTGTDTTTGSESGSNNSSGTSTDKGSNSSVTSTGMNSTTTDDGNKTSIVSENKTFSGNESNVSESSNIETSHNSINDNENRTKNNNVNVNKSNIGSMSNTEEYIEHVFGKRGTVSNSKLLKEFRDTFLNIDKMIIDELSILFFGLW